MTRFGTLRDGGDVQSVTIAAHGLRATILTLGAILQDVRLDGVDHSLTIGSNDLADYEGAMKYFGCIVAPVANRISNATTVINAEHHQFEPNQPPHTLHSGSTGAFQSVWHIDEAGQNRVVLSIILPDGLGGFPGTRHIKAGFEIVEGPALRLTITTTTDAPSIVNATNHSYWNLDGTADSGAHRLRLAADHVLPVDDASLVTGEVADVTDTAFDFRTAKPITPDAPPLDNTFCVAHDRRDLTECAWIMGASGITMAVSTTEAGVHIYDGRDSGYQGIAVEAQGWPDAPNHPHFPRIDITPDAPVVQVTQWRFSR